MYFSSINLSQPRMTHVTLDSFQSESNSEHFNFKQYDKVNFSAFLDYIAHVPCTDAMYAGNERERI